MMRWPDFVILLGCLENFLEIVDRFRNSFVLDAIFDFRASLVKFFVHGSQVRQDSVAVIFFGQFVQLHLLEDGKLRSVGSEIGSNSVLDKGIFD